MKLETARDEYLANLRDGIRGDGMPRRRASGRTLFRYREELNRFIHWVIVTTGKSSVLQFNSDLVKGYRDHRSTVRNVSVNTLSLDSVILRGFAQWGVEKRYWRYDDVRALPYIPKARTLPRPYPSIERDAILSLALEVDETCLRALLFFGGLRNEETRTVMLKDVYPPHALPDGTTIPAQLFVRGKGAKERTVPLHPDGWADVAPQLKVRRAHGGRPEDPLLVKPNGQPWTEDMIQRRLKGWGRAAGVDKVTAHRARHRYATDLLESGSDLRDVQKALGHSSPATTQIYTQITDVRLNAAVLRMPGKPMTDPRDSATPGIVAPEPSETP